MKTETEMNLITIKDKSLVATKNTLTNKGQKLLYSLIINKLENNSPITIQEVIELWVENVSRDVKEGSPVYWNHWANSFKDENNITQHKGGWEKLPYCYIKQYSIMWLTRTIGTLVMKGFLKIIPQLELSL